MKYCEMHVAGVTHKSLPMRGEWIEINILSIYPAIGLSLPMRGEWIEISSPFPVSIASWSLPMRGEWIEMLLVRLYS